MHPGQGAHDLLTRNFVQTAVTLSISASSAEIASALNPGKLYSIIATAACYITQGATGLTATTSDHYLALEERTYFSVAKTGVDDYIAAVCDTGGSGKLFIQELTA
jgi:hypothetical protein